MPKYRVTTPVFIAPDLIPAGTIIDYEGTPSITLEPLDPEAEAALQEVYRAKPNAGIKPFEELRTVGGEPGEKVSATVVEKPKADDVTGTLAAPGKAQPGLTEGGKALTLK